MTDLPQTIDELADAQARQTRFWAEMLGTEQELEDARAAWRALWGTLEQRWLEARHEWARAKRDVERAVVALDEMVRS